MTGSNGAGLILQERDRSLLRELNVLRVIDREQAKLVGGFRSTTRANARLLALTNAGFLRRFFLGTTAGGRRAIYSLSTKGAATVQVTGYAPQRKPDALLAADLFIEHQLALNSVLFGFRYGPAPPDVSLRRWMYFQKPLSQSTALIPDGYVELAFPSGIKGMFLEVDQGTESSRVWAKKGELYIRLARSREFPALFHQSQFRVLVIAPTERRLLSIRATIAKLTDKIFWFSSLESLNHDFWSTGWIRPTGDQKHSLI
jgi:hypothetical protein